MTSVEITFWLSVAILFYCYVGYGILLYAWNTVKSLFLPLANPPDFELLPVTLVVAAYNEEAVLKEKINNTLQIDYPADRFQVVFITDGSTDGSVELIGRYNFITVLHQSRRQGKSAAIRRAMRFVRTPIVVFSDANAMLNSGCIKAIVRHYHDKKVGGVAGEKKIIKNERTSIIGEAEGLYWKYESFMKKQESAFNTVIGGAGELFSIRTELFQLPDDNLVLDDFMMSMQVCLEGYKIKYEAGAYALENASASLWEEEKRKTRIAAGAYQSAEYLRQAFHVFKDPLLSFQYISRRLLRWVASPILILLVLATNVWLVVHQPGITFNSLLLAQVIFYSLALLGRIFVAIGRRVGILNIPFYFLFMNICLVKGFFKYIQGGQSVLWEKSLREAMK
jgi:poly-beta-1,6-N-acetyl-D-glucosamine synthase